MINALPILLMFSFFTSPATEPEFEAQLIDGNVAIGYGIAIGDVDGDGKPDILLADKKQFAWYRNGDWKRFVMAENLTESDNVCIAARDIDGDGKVEVAVGAQWNPGETSDTLRSGSVHFLIRQDDPTKMWIPVKLHHEPTTHRMRWVRAAANTYHLIVLPLHGRGNKNGEGTGVKVIAYEKPAGSKSEWKHYRVDESMHLTHNFDVVKHGSNEAIYVAGKEGIKMFSFARGKWSPFNNGWFVKDKSFGEVRVADEGRFVAGIEPMHGNALTVYNPARTVLTSDLNQGHALAVADLLGLGNNEVVVGWREPDKENKVGIKIFIADKTQATGWKDFWVDNNGIACEDLQVADLDGDGKKDIIAAGRASHNLKIYWNRSF